MLNMLYLQKNTAREKVLIKNSLSMNMHKIYIWMFSQMFMIHQKILYKFFWQSSKILQ